jgi:hypothetical protein
LLPLRLDHVKNDHNKTIAIDDSLHHQSSAQYFLTMKGFSFVGLGLLPLFLVVLMVTADEVLPAAQTSREYIIVGVSGGLQEGFPEHTRMDYKSGQPEEVQAVFLGRALVRGYKAFLDVMQPGWRQYIPEPEQPLINCNVVPSGCWHHANEYWMYLVDSRQFLAILMGEPRFLSIAPDLGLVDLQAEETGSVIKHIALQQMERQGKTDKSAVAFPIVTAAWYNPTSHVPSPVLYIKEDGTQVTNFAQSLAKWAGIDIAQEACSADNETFSFLEQESQQDFWDALRRSIRYAEANRQPESNGPPFVCKKKARFGVSSDMARINYSFQPEEVKEMLKLGGFDIDFEKAVVTSAL